MSNMQVVRADGAPLSFRVPPGWPRPTELWVMVNQDWTLPAQGWVPRRGVPAAPAGWTFWERNAAWGEIAHAVNAPNRTRLWWGVGSLVLGIVLSASGVALFYGLMLVGVWLIISAAVRMSRTSSTVLALTHHTARETRSEVVREAYDHYLGSAGGP